MHWHFYGCFFSPITLAILATPTMAPGEEAGAGDGIILIPVVAEIAIVLIVYTIALLYWRPARQGPSASHSPS
ncbi:hypothetical protein [Rhizobium etli]|uniref:hypothetical protein n=1 Tax=Rhizobium etli TaxID=29449 RepID=UPI001FEFE535|nr:hypothetical protein [Rhizobium etli]